MLRIVLLLAGGLLFTLAVWAFSMALFAANAVLGSPQSLGMLLVGLLLLGGAVACVLPLARPVQGKREPFAEPVAAAPDDARTHAD